MRLAQYYVIATLPFRSPTRRDALPSGLVRLAAYIISIFTSVMASLRIIEYLARSIQHWELGVDTLGGR